jgi:hypothetical protein
MSGAVMIQVSVTLLTPAIPRNSEFLDSRLSLS